VPQRVEADGVLPIGVLGSVLLRAFWRFAAAFLGLDICAYPSGV
jgi:hypothetical protein